MDSKNNGILPQTEPITTAPQPNQFAALENIELNNQNVEEKKKKRVENYDGCCLCCYDPCSDLWCWGCFRNTWLCCAEASEQETSCCDDGDCNCCDGCGCDGGGGDVADGAAGDGCDCDCGGADGCDCGGCDCDGCFN